MPAPAPTPSHVLTTEGEAGVVVSGGNANAQSYDFKDSSSYAFDGNTFKLKAHYLDSSASSVETARNWDLGLRYERLIIEKLSGYAAETLDGDTFAGYTQRYNSDVGGKYLIIKNKELSWSGEAGYELSIQNNNVGTSATDHFIRLYTEVSYDWTPTFNTKYGFEALPSLTDSNLFRLNSTLGATAAISSIFSIKLSYDVKYNNAPPAGVVFKTDSVFTTALVAKFDSSKTAEGERKKAD